MSSAISYTIPLKDAPETYYIGTKEELAGEAHEASAIKEKKCTGDEEAPQAAPGNLCVFAVAEENSKEYLFRGLLPTHFIDSATNLGAVVADESSAAGEVFTNGSWVVTGS